MKRPVYLLGLLLAGTVLAQESASFKLTESTFTQGGHPLDGMELTSTSFQMTLDAVGQVVAPTSIGSTSYSLGTGFVTTFAPAGEVANLRFTDATTLVWDPAGIREYALYSGQVTFPFDPDFGTCQQPPPPLTTETATVAATPRISLASFFLVTTHNRLGEEGIKGPGRLNPFPCP